MKAVVIAVLATLLSSLSAVANQGSAQISRFEFAAQGLCVQLQVNKATSQVVASVNANLQQAYASSYKFLDGRPRLVVELTQDNLPTLRADQNTYYDSRLDHHSITELTVILDSKGQVVEEVDYDRHQDIDYGYDSESSVLEFSNGSCSAPAPAVELPLVSFVNQFNLMSSETDDIKLELVLSRSSSAPVSVTVNLVDETAKLGRDYSGFSSSPLSVTAEVVFPPGVTKLQLPRILGRASVAACGKVFQAQISPAKLTGARTVNSNALIQVACLSN